MLVSTRPLGYAPRPFLGWKNQGKETLAHRFMFIREIPSPKGLYLVVLKGHILSVLNSIEFVEGSHLIPIAKPPPCAKIKRHGHLTLEKASSVLHFSVPLLHQEKVNGVAGSPRLGQKEG